jgi:NitT/TauT family transport system permease protein
MLIALAASLVFTFTYATLAAKSRRAALILIPLLDILQSVPILGFISLTVVAFMALAPGRVLGAELAAIFAIFTSQAWNMAFSFYQSLRTVPEDLDEACRSLRMSAWLRFWRVEVPFAMPGLIWNMMMSMSGAWFFVVAAEAITVGNTTITLPGVGSYVARAIAERDLAAVGYAIVAMLGVILLYDQLLFRPLVAWADRFRLEPAAGETAPGSLVLTMLRRARLLQAAAAPVKHALRRPLGAPPAAPAAGELARLMSSRFADRIWTALIALLALAALWRILVFVGAHIAPGEVLTALILGLATLARVVVLIAIASLVWVPVGVKVGLDPKLKRLVQPLAQFLAAFPANLLFPVAVVAIVRFQLDPDVWLSPLMILGTQWYILFNVIAGASALPGDLRDAASNLRIMGWTWWRRVMLPGVFPYYLTGAITATGGSWNASILAEAASWGDTRLVAHGLGAYIAEATQSGDHPRIVLGIAVMSLLVLVFNRLLWRPLYAYAERRFRLG